MPAAALIPAVIGAGSSIASGVIGSRAAKSAAAQQAAAAAQAAQIATQTGDRAATDITAAGENAAQGVTDATTQAAGGVSTAGANSAAGLRLGADEANELLRAIYGDAFGTLQPYRDAGSQAVTTLSSLLSPSGDFNKPYTADQLPMDPGYQFRLQEGQKALERSAAARGNLQGGGTLKALTQYSQGVASQEYQNAFNRFQQDRQSRFNMLTGLAGIGQRAADSTIAAGENYGNRAAGNITDAAAGGAAYGYNSARDAGNFRVSGADQAGRFRLSSVGQAGQFRTDAARTAAEAVTGAGNARAAGTVGSANAWSGALGSIGKIGQDIPWGSVFRRSAAPAGRFEDITAGMG